jgi:3-deoxy-7-phosphoheptulonate synthase
MLIIMRTTATHEQVENVVARVEQYGLRAHLSHGTERVIIGAVGDGRPVSQDEFAVLPGVDRVVPISRPYKLASREFSPENTRFRLGQVEVGGGEVLLIAGPCAVESRSQTLEIAHAVREAGAHALRGGAYKPRTSPYTFQGLGEAGLAILAEARQETGLPVVSEVMSPEQVPQVGAYVDVFQVGARNMQNFTLLHAVGETQKPVLLKRGMSATLEELLMAAEYILSHGNRRVLLCERGIRTFETATRSTTDINAIPALHALSHLPVILDPSHSTGHWEYVSAVARAGVAAGADGLIVEVHARPEEALSDGAQSLKPERFAHLVAEVRAVAQAVGRGVPQNGIPIPARVEQPYSVGDVQ